MSDRPNILYLHSHNSGKYIQPYGHAVSTPNMQKLAEEGVLFRNAFCAHPTCSPSRASLLTGQFPHNNGMIGLAHRGFRISDYSQLITFTLKKAGYTTILSGLRHISNDDSVLGYDKILGDFSTAEITACDFLNQKPKEPFFLDVGFFENHLRGRTGYFHEDGPKGDPRYVVPPACLPDLPEIREQWADYCVSANRLDFKIGQVLECLKKNGLAEKTLVICVTDHGLQFPFHMCNLTDHGISTYLILRGPEGFSGGRVLNSMVTHLDLYPTLCDLAGTETPPFAQGKSLLPLVNNSVKDLHKEIFSEIDFHASYEPQRCVRTSRWKYIKRFDGRSAPVLPNTDDSPSKRLLLEHGWRDVPLPQEQLYDLILDPVERNNLASHPEYQSSLNDMRAKLSSWMASSSDPFRSGSISAPEGATHNDPDHLSNHEKTVPAVV